MEFVAADVPLERLIEEVTPLRKCRADDVRWIPGRHFGMAEELAAVSGAPERRSSALLYGWRSLRRVRPAKGEGLVDSPATRADAGPTLYTSKADPRFQRLR